MAAINYGGFAITHGQTLGQLSASVFTNPLQIVQLNWTGLKREAIDVSSMLIQPTVGSGLGNLMYVPSAYVDPGELDLTVLHDPTLTPIPIEDPSKVGPTTFTITLGPSTTQQETFQGLGFVTSYEMNGPMNGKALTASVKIKLTDAVGSAYGTGGALSQTIAS